MEYTTSKRSTRKRPKSSKWQRQWKPIKPVLTCGDHNLGRQNSTLDKGPTQAATYHTCHLIKHYSHTINLTAYVKYWMWCETAQNRNTSQRYMRYSRHVIWICVVLMCSIKHPHLLIFYYNLFHFISNFKIIQNRNDQISKYFFSPYINRSQLYTSARVKNNKACFVTEKRVLHTQIAQQRENTVWGC